MPHFDDIHNIFAPNRKLNDAEIIRAIKLGIASEYESTQIYQQIMESTDNNDVKIILQGIAEDEMHHAGKLMKLLEILSPLDAKEQQIGIQKALDILNTGK
ncbi:MAG: hypothetical protein NC218_09810 [Acetobacter sp.]|nr:hypothetical protein [Acetobacter sp.]